MFVNYDSFKAILKANNTKLSTLIDSKVAEVKTFTVKKVDVLPEAGEEKVLYLVAKEGAEGQNVCTEFLYVDGAFEEIGDTAVSLVDYYTKEEVDAALELKADASALDAYATTEAMTQAIADAAYELPVATTDVVGGVKVDGTTVTVTEDGTISAVIPEAVSLEGYAKTTEVTEAIEAAVAGKADASDLDAYATAESVTQAIEAAVADKADASALDAYATTESVTQAIETAVAGKADASALDAYATTESVATSIEEAAYELPEATAETLGGVKVDGTTITVEGGVISAVIPEVEDKTLTSEEVTTLINEVWA